MNPLKKLGLVSSLTRDMTHLSVLRKLSKKNNSPEFREKVQLKTQKILQKLEKVQTEYDDPTLESAIAKIKQELEQEYKENLTDGK